ncbi:MAG: type II secretion system protein [Gallionella sp.]
MMRRQSQQGFTLVEMIMVIVITGIIGGMVAVFLKTPIQQYMDVARRADMTDIADTALRRIGRDLRLALPNSVRVTPGACPVTTANPGGTGTCSFLEFLPTSGGGRYRADTGGGAGCPASPGGEALDFTGADACFGVLGGMPAGFAFAAGDLVAVYNLGISGATAYSGVNTAAINLAGSTAAIITLNTAKLFQLASPKARFDIINKAVSYVCDTTGKTLMRYSYPIVAGQPTATLTGGNLLAGNVGAICNFSYDAFVVAQRSGLVTMNLSITENNPSGGNETVTLYNATHVSNLP